MKTTIVPTVGQKVRIIPSAVDSDRYFEGEVAGVDGNEVYILWNGNARATGNLQGRLPHWPAGARWEPIAGE